MRFRYDKLKTYLEDSTMNGHSFALGSNFDELAESGLFVPLTIVDNPPNNSKIVAEEPFGPVFPILRWNDEADVIKRASTHTYSLQHFRSLIELCPR
jgi:acyl-CoA reductase-like NAD-dependent aldehyde dehydrogenase